VPADVQACARSPVVPPDRELNAGEVERLWNTDRATLAKVNACLHRLVCQYQDVRQGIGRVDGAGCDDKPAQVETTIRRRPLNHLKLSKGR
jgi:hypothetical protein